MSDYMEEADYENLALLIAGIVGYLIDHDSASIPMSYFQKDYSNNRLSVVHDTLRNSLVFDFEELPEEDLYLDGDFDES
jgi:hypothetical protein